MERLFTRLYAGLAVCGLLVIVLSFLPWVKFHSGTFEGDTGAKVTITLSGTHTSRWRDLDEIGRNDAIEEDGWCSCHVGAGDGYFTAGLGAVLVLIAAFGWRSELDRPASIAGGIVSLGVLGLSGFDAIAAWQAIIYTNLQRLEAADGSIQPALLAVVAASAVAAVLSGLALGFAWLYDQPDDEDEEMIIADENSTNGGSESWA
jgi:hypothetical protein